MNRDCAACVWYPGANLACEYCFESNSFAERTCRNCKHNLFSPANPVCEDCDNGINWRPKGELT